MPTMEPSTKEWRRAEAATLFTSTGCSAAETLLARPRAVSQGFNSALPLLESRSATSGSPPRCSRQKTGGAGIRPGGLRSRLNRVNAGTNWIPQGLSAAGKAPLG